MLAENDSVKTILISGDPDLCKAFLFESAVTWAKEGQYVYYFATKQFESLPMIFHDRSEPSADASRLMTFFYVKSYEGLITQLTKLQTFQKPPSVILIDDLNEFANHPDIHNSSRIMHVARCCAIILNAAYSCAQVIGKTVQVCAANFHSDARSASNERMLKNTYEKYFDNRWTFKADEDDVDGRRAWLKSEDGKDTMEYQRLDDSVLLLRKVFKKEVTCAAV